MKKLLLVFLVLSYYGFAQGQKQTSKEKDHFVCIQSADVYHNKATCASLQMCSGGKIRKTKNVDNLKPCKKCIVQGHRYRSSGFSNIKNVLGVKDKKQIADSLGTTEGTIHRPTGLSIRITGPPNSRTVNMVEFYFDKPVPFNEDSLFSWQFYDRLGLQFEGCKADTIRNNTPHPVTKKIKKDVSIEYRGCAVVEARDQYEDTSKYYYELIFLPKELDASSELEKIQLILRVER